MPACLDGKYVPDRADVKNAIESGGWKVAYGRELTETDAAWGIFSAVLDYFTGGVSFEVWLDSLIDESLAQMAKSIRDTFGADARQEATQFSEDVISNLLQFKNASERFHDLFQYDFKAGLAKFTGHNYVWLCNFSREGGYWQEDTQPQVSFCPYVGIRYNKSTGLTRPGHRTLWIGEDGIFYRKHSSGEWHSFVGLQAPNFLVASQETGRDDNYVYLRDANGHEVALGTNMVYSRFYGQSTEWKKLTQGFWRS